MNYEVAFPADVFQRARNHVLRHILANEDQEDLCFALWRPSTGQARYAALIWDLVLPGDGDTELHGNISFDSEYFRRALRRAHAEGVGIALIHSHPAPGWQGLSEDDVTAERDRIGPPSAITGLPVVGITMGSDASLSARFWFRKVREPIWCRKVRVTGKHSLALTYNENSYPTYSRRPELERTADSWGLRAQQTLARLRVGIVGVGSVGAIVAEMVARMGVEEVLLVDADAVERHNLDRLIHASRRDIGKKKVQLVASHISRAATAGNFRVTALAHNLQHPPCYRAALDCDILFSCVDRPIPKDILNNIAYVHCVPVIFGGIQIGNKSDGRLAHATWAVARLTSATRCLRCWNQYSTSDVIQEHDGTLDDPQYIVEAGTPNNALRNQNVASFSGSLATMMVNEMIRYIISEEWWPRAPTGFTYSFVPNRIDPDDGTECHPHCEVRSRTALGDGYQYPFLIPERLAHAGPIERLVARFRKYFQE